MICEFGDNLLPNQERAR